MAIVKDLLNAMGIAQILRYSLLRLNQPRGTVLACNTAGPRFNPRWSESEGRWQCVHNDPSELHAVMGLHAHRRGGD